MFLLKLNEFYFESFIVRDFSVELISNDEGVLKEVSYFQLFIEELLLQLLNFLLQLANLFCLLLVEQLLLDDLLTL